MFSAADAVGHATLETDVNAVVEKARPSRGRRILSHATLYVARAPVSSLLHLHLAPSSMPSLRVPPSFTTTFRALFSPTL